MELKRSFYGRDSVGLHERDKKVPDKQARRRRRRRVSAAERAGWSEGEGKEGRKRRKLSEAELCAANVIQAWLIQQRLLWRPTMRLSGAQTAETRREKREGRRKAASTGGGGEGAGPPGQNKSTSQEPSDLDFSLNAAAVVRCVLSRVLKPAARKWSNCKVGMSGWVAAVPLHWESQDPQQFTKHEATTQMHPTHKCIPKKDNIKKAQSLSCLINR